MPDEKRFSSRNDLPLSNNNTAEATVDSNKDKTVLGEGRRRSDGNSKTDDIVASRSKENLVPGAKKPSEDPTQSVLPPRPRQSTPDTKEEAFETVLCFYFIA